MADLHGSHMRAEMSFKTYCSSVSPSGTFCQIWNLEQCWHYSLTPERIDHSILLHHSAELWQGEEKNITTFQRVCLSLLHRMQHISAKKRMGWCGTSSTCIKDYFQSFMFVLLKMNSYSMTMDIFSVKGKKPDYQITGYQIWITDRVGCSRSLWFYVCV